MTNIINLGSESYFPLSVLYFKFLQWYCKTTVFAEKPRAWSMEQSIESIWKFDGILISTTRAFDSSDDNYLDAITVCQLFIAAV